MPDGDSQASLIERLLSPEFTGPTAKRLGGEEFKELLANLLGAEKTTGVPVSKLAGMPGLDLAALLGTDGEGGGIWQALAESIRAASAGQAATDSAAAALQRELGLGNLALAQKTQAAAERLGLGQLSLAEQVQAAAEEQFGITQAFAEKTSTAEQLLGAAGLAASPTGAIQLAHLARGEGAPQDLVAQLFQNLPFVQELLVGQNAPGFGLPEQLGGEMRRVPAGGDVIQGRNLGVTLPGKKSITRQAYGTLSEFEQAFLGALGQSETGQAAGGFLEDIMKSFIPTRTAGPLAIT